MADLRYLGRGAAVLGLALAVSGCAASPARDLDATLAALQQGQARASAEANQRAADDLADLRLPVTDHLSAVKYCAFMARNIAAEPATLLEGARTRAGFAEAVPALPDEVRDAIDFGALFPTVRETPVFNRRLPEQAVYLAAEPGSCILLTLDEPGAAERTRSWLTSPASGWIEVKGARNSPWRAYKVAKPDLITNSLVVFEAQVSDAARRRGVSAVHVIAMAGLP